MLIKLKWSYRCLQIWYYYISTIISKYNYPFILGPRRLDGLRAVDVMGVLQEQLAILSGGRDRRGGALLTFPATPRRERTKPEDYRTLLQYLLGVPW